MFDRLKGYNPRLMRRQLVVVLMALLLWACGGKAGDPEVARGRQVFAEHCAACHSVNPDLVIVGPSLDGIASRAADTEPGLEAREYLRRTILNPRAEITEGFDDLMPPDFEQKIVGSDLEALLSYLLTLE